MSIFLARELEQQSAGLKALAKIGNVPSRKAAEIASELHALSLIARAIEQELQVHRLLEAGRHGRRMVDELASATALPLATEGNIVRPDFGRRK